MAILFGIELLLLIAAAAALYMAWGIGANDVANAMGTSVGSGALTFRQAILVAAIFEFAGAVLVGAHVTQTVRKGIVDPAAFAAPAATGGGNTTNMTAGGGVVPTGGGFNIHQGLIEGVQPSPDIFVYGMIAALLAAALWLTLATIYSLPVSTTHSIVGAITGFGVVSLGIDGVDWNVVGQIVASWIISPVLGALVAAMTFIVISRAIFRADDPVAAIRRHGFWFVASAVVIIGMATLFKGLKNLNLDFSLGESLLLSVALAIPIGLFGHWLIRRRPVQDGVDRAAKRREVEGIFAILQVVTAASVAFAHGANDVANAIGPLAAVASTLEGGVVAAKAVVPLWVLVLGGTGIVIGLATYGYRVIMTIGTKITELTPSRGYAAEISAALTILTFSRLGMPISTTHTLVGCVIGVGLARGIPALDLKVIGKIFLSWAATLPIAALTTIVIYVGILFGVGAIGGL